MTGVKRPRMALATSFLALLFPACTSREVVEKDFEPRPHFWTAGDATAGKKAFLELKCNTCHRVAGEDFPLLSQVHPGPAIGNAQAGRGSEWIAEAVVQPSHSVSSLAGAWQGKSSSMGDYSNVMTVRQLMDIVAYIQSKEF